MIFIVHWSIRPTVIVVSEMRGAAVSFVRKYVKYYFTSKYYNNDKNVRIV